MREKIELNFETAKQKDDFLAWFFDAGGETSYGDFLDAHELEPIITKQSVKGAWDSIDFETCNE